jgi:GNAT superfamily N-acetyltransferase
MHTIRLRGGWAVTESGPGVVRHTRRFGRPRTLDPNETLRLLIASPPFAVVVNDQPVTVGTDIRAAVAERNVLTLDYPTAVDPDVILEIRAEPLTLSPSTDSDYPFTHDLTRSNMSGYVAKYWGGWDETIYRTNYDRTENLLLRLGPDRIGFVRLEIADRTLLLEDAQILPAYQNRGLGGWMLERVVEIAAERGCVVVKLRCFKDNPARNLYPRSGFAVVEDTGIAEWFERPVSPRNSSSTSVPTSADQAATSRR